MKKTFFAVFLLILSFGLSASQLTPKGSLNVFKLTENNNPVPIVVPDDYTEGHETRYVTDLQKYLKQIYDLELPVVKEENYRGGACISLGNTKLFAASPFAKNQKKLNDDGIGLHLKNRILYIYGGSWHGTQNAVYCLLEEDLGCRFWNKKGDDSDTDNNYRYIPKIKSPAIKFVPRNYNPPFIIRDTHHDQKWADVIIDTNRIHFLDLALGQAHTTFNLVSPDNYKEHPEWFSEIDGKRVPDQLCFSNPEVIKLMTENARKYLKESGKNVIGISPQDSYPLCDCKVCRELDGKEGTKSATLIKCLNAVYDNLKDEFLNLKIQTLAYLDYVKAPKTVKPNKNIMVQVCSDSCDWYEPFCTFDETQKFQKDCKDWCDSGAFVYVWTYNQNFDHYLLPYPNYQKIAKDLKLLRDFGVKGVFTQVGYGTHADAYCDDEFMKTWVWAHLMWNPDWDYKKLREEFIKGYYRECAEPILEYEKLLDNLYSENHKTFKVQADEKNYVLGSHPLLPINRIRYAPDVELYTDEFAAKSLELTEKAVSLAKSDESRKKIREMRLYPLYLNLGRTLGHRNEFGRFIPKKFDRSKSEIYKAWLDEFESIVLENGIDCLGEISPRSLMKNDRETYIQSFRAVLDFDPSEFAVREINTPWKFIRDPERKINPLDNGFDTSSWTDMPCNTNWETVIGDYDGFAWYQRTENFAKEELEKKNIILMFGAVDEDATVYVNGKLALEHTGAKLSLTGNEIWDRPFCVNIKEFLNEGENQIKVLVHDEAKAGGIWQPVKIVLTDRDMDFNDLLTVLN